MPTHLIHDEAWGQGQLMGRGWAKQDVIAKALRSDRDWIHKRGRIRLGSVVRGSVVRLGSVQLAYPLLAVSE